ncbi:hypothetical protein ES703_113503 [subsurface metagenome]
MKSFLKERNILVFCVNSVFVCLFVLRGQISDFSLSVDAARTIVYKLSSTASLFKGLVFPHHGYFPSSLRACVCALN